MNMIARIEKLEKILDKCGELHTSKWDIGMSDAQQEVAYDRWVSIRQAHIAEWLKLLTVDQVREWKEIEACGISPRVSVQSHYEYPNL